MSVYVVGVFIMGKVGGEGGGGGGEGGIVVVSETQRVDCCGE